MINPHDIVCRTALSPRIVNTTGQSAVVDTEGAAWALIRFHAGSVATAARFRARSCSASSTLYASGTAFATVIDTSTFTASHRTYAYLVNMRTAQRRYIRVVASAVTTSAKVAVFVDLHWNKLVPPTDLLDTASPPVSGFHAFTVVE